MTCKRCEGKAVQSYLTLLWGLVPICSTCVVNGLVMINRRAA